MSRNYRGPERRKPILIAQHAPHEHPAAIRRALSTQGIVSQWIHPYRGDSYPSSDCISGIISLGGPMSANDESEHHWIPEEIGLLRRLVEKDLPVVGVCLGGQMLARALGGRVEKHHTAEIGWFPLEVNEIGLQDPIIGVAGQSPTVYHWHGDTFFPPSGAVPLARSEICERQAYRYGERAYGFQFHPEADHQLIHEWLAIEGVEQEILEAREQHGPGTVQDAGTQRNHALMGEKASLKITAAIAAFFRQRSIEEAPEEIRRQVTDLATHRAKAIVDFEDPNRKIARIIGMIATILAIPAGDFVILKDESSLLWPIRLSDILQISRAE